MKRIKSHSIKNMIWASIMTDGVLEFFGPGDDTMFLFCRVVVLRRNGIQIQRKMSLVFFVDPQIDMKTFLELGITDGCAKLCRRYASSVTNGVQIDWHENS